MSALSEDPGGEPSSAALLTYEEISRHTTPQDCWIVVNGKAYDVTDFLDDHPGGPAVVLEAAGVDSTAAFLEAHPEDIMKLTLGPAGLAKSLVGPVDMSSMPLHAKKAEPGKKEEAAGDGLEDADGIPPLGAILNLHDMEAVAQRVMVAKGKKHAWDYYSSGADDELTYNDNVNAFQRIWLKPRILVNVAEVDTSCSILGHSCKLPIYLSAVAMCGMGHEEGEISWVRAAERAGVLFMVPNLSSKSFDDILAARGPGQVVFLQIYVNPDRSVVLEQIRSCEKHGVKALCITVDSAVAGKRERDLRNKLAMQLGREKQQAAAAKGTPARKAGSYANRDPGLDWGDIAWFRKQTSIPIVIKGVQTADDAVLAAKAGAAGVVLSNHGGRNCDTSRSGIEVLPEVIEALKEEGLRDQLEVWVDGGVRRGTDVLKAICMGADAVGLGKPAVFSMSAYGEDGIVKMLDTLKEELEKCMRLCGTPTLADLNPRLVDARSVGRHTDVAPIPPSPYAYEPPAKSVRSPAFPSMPQERDKIQAEIAKLTQALHKLERADGSGGRYAIADTARVFVKLLKVMLVSVLSTVFATSYSGSLHRSALFLLVFLVVHMGGNLTALFGRDAYNSYGHHLNSMPFIRVIELYLAVGMVVHLFTAAHFTVNKRKAIKKGPLTTGLLALTGTILLAFVVLHLKAFRFSTSTRRWRHPDALANAPSDRDLYYLMLELFEQPAQVMFYVSAIVAVGVHLHRGWSKTVLKMDGLLKEERQPVIAIGHVLIIPLCVGFCLVPCWMHAIQKQWFAEMIGRTVEGVITCENATTAGLA